MNPADSEVRQEVYEIVSRQYDLKGNMLTDDTNFFCDLNADSLDFLDTVLGLESKLKVKIPDEDAPNLYNLGRLVRYIEEKIKTSSDSRVSIPA